jgi:hypothetical protein
VTLFSLDAPGWPEIRDNSVAKINNGPTLKRMRPEAPAADFGRLRRREYLPQVFTSPDVLDSFATGRLGQMTANLPNGESYRYENRRNCARERAMWKPASRVLIAY